MMNLILTKDILGGLLVLTSIGDAWKYIWQSKSIKKVGTARGHSRKFINAALLNDTTKLCYGIVIDDLFIILSSLLALGTMSYLFWTIYKFYPYKYRGLQNFRKPNILLYFWNSITPNSIRKKL